MVSGGSNNVYEFRRAVSPIPVHSADALGRGVSLSVASPNIGLAPSDSPQNDHSARLFEPSERGNEIFVCTDALASAHGIYAWVAICVAVECAGAVLWAFT